MKKIYLLSFLMTVFFGAWQVSAQCTTGGTYGLNPTLNDTSVSVPLYGNEDFNCYYGGDFAPITIANVGFYHFTSSVSTDYLTVTNNTGATVIAHGVQPLEVEFTSTGGYRVYVHTNAACGTQSSCRDLRGSYGLIPPPPPPPGCGEATTLCYGNNLSNTVLATYEADNPADEITIEFTSGNVESCCDYFIIYEGVGTGGTLIQSNVTGDLAGLSFTAVGAITVAATSDGLWSCATGPAQFTTAELTISCVPAAGGGGGATAGSIFEDFNSGFPAGWSTDIISGSCDWELHTPLTALPGFWPAGYVFPTDAMYFDDDACGSGQPANTALLYSDVYDMSGNTVVFAEMSYDAIYYQSGTSYLRVEVYDGAAWVQVANYTTTRNVANSASGTIDVSAYANPDFQVRFTYGETTAGWNYGAGIDNFALDFEMADVIGNAPQIICPNNITVLSSNYPQDDCGAQVFFNDAQAFDPEDGLLPVTQTMGLVSGSVFPIGENIIEFSTTDSDGNVSTCQFTVTVVDDIDPVAACQNYTIQLDENGIATLDAEMLNEGYGFTCTYSVGLYDTFGDGWNGGALDVVVGGVTVLEGITVLSGAGPEWFDFEVMPGQSIEILYTAGSWSTENWFEVSDGPDGTGDVIYNTPTGQTPAASHNVDNLCESGDGSSDLCGDVFFSFDEDGLITSIDMECMELGENMVTLYITDEGGNQVTCDVLVTVEDNIAPEIVCLGGGGAGDLTPIMCAGNPGPTSAADSNLISFTITGANGSEIDYDYTCGELGLQDLTSNQVELMPGQQYTAELVLWSCGTSQYTAQAYVWIDFNGDGELTSDEIIMTGSQAFVSGGGPNGASPTGGTLISETFTVPANAAQGPVIIRTMAQETSITPLLPCASFSWGTMADFTANILNPNPGGVPQYFLDANGEVSVPITDLYDSVSDNCSVTVTVGGTGAESCEFSTPSNNLENGHGNLNLLTIANDFTVAAGSGFTADELKFNLIHNVGITPTGVDVTFYEDSGNGPGAVLYTETNVAPTSIVQVGTNFGFPFSEVTLPLSGQQFDAGASDTVFWVGIQLQGYAGANSYWEVTTTLNSDNQEYIDLNDGLGFQTSTVVFGEAVDGVFTLSGTCGGAGGSNYTFTCADLGMTTVTVTATDAAGNSTSCTSTVEIIDDIAPVLVTQDIVVELDENGQATVGYEDFYASSPDDYEVITIGSDGLAGAGTTDLTVTLTEDETISFNWNYTTTDIPGFDNFGYLLNGTYTQLTSDAVGNQSGSESISLSAGDVFGFRVATDDNFGGAGQALITDFMPGFQGQFAPENWNETLTNSNGSTNFIIIPGGVLAYDNCGITTGAVDITTFTCDDIGDPIEVTIFVSDASGNVASSTATVTVVDAMAPVIECLEDQTVFTDPEAITYAIPDYVAEELIMVTDNCTDPVTEITQTPAPGTLLLVGTHTVTITAMDEYGNESSCSFELTVEDELGQQEILKDAVVMYPNPADHIFYITNSSSIVLTELVMYDVAGKIVNKVDLSQMVGEQAVDVSELSSGVYMVRIQSETTSVVKRLIKK